MRAWTGPAITAKVFIPLALAFIAGLVAIPVRDFFTTAWFFLVVFPAAGTAIWLFSNIGEIRPSADGLLYRKWIRWEHIPSGEISNVVRVFPCFAALVLDEHVKLFFFPDPDARRIIRSLPTALHTDGAIIQNHDTLPLPFRSFLRGVFSFLIGIVSGIAIWAVRGPAASFDLRSSALVHFGDRYAPLFVDISLLYLISLVLARRLPSRELHVSLALIGLGIVYLSTAVFHVL